MATINEKAEIEENNDFPIPKIKLATISKKAAVDRNNNFNVSNPDHIPILKKSSIGVNGSNEENYKKYFQATDILEIQIGGVRKREETKQEFLNVIFALIDLIDFTKASTMILEKDYFQQFLDLEKMCYKYKLNRDRDRIIQAMFTQAIRLDYEPISLMLVLKFESVMLRSTAIVVPAIM